MSFWVLCADKCATYPLTAVIATWWSQPSSSPNRAFGEGLQKKRGTITTKFVLKSFKNTSFDCRQASVYPPEFLVVQGEAIEKIAILKFNPNTEKVHRRWTKCVQQFLRFANVKPSSQFCSKRQQLKAKASPQFQNKSSWWFSFLCPPPQIRGQGQDSFFDLFFRFHLNCYWIRGTAPGLLALIPFSIISPNNRMLLLVLWLFWPLYNGENNHFSCIWPSIIIVLSQCRLFFSDCRYKWVSIGPGQKSWKPSFGFGKVFQHSKIVDSSCKFHLPTTLIWSWSLFLQRFSCTLSVGGFCVRTRTNTSCCRKKDLAAAATGAAIGWFWSDKSVIGCNC